METLFSELTTTEQESLSGGQSYNNNSGNYYYFNKDNWDCYKYYNQNWGGTYYQCYPANRKGQEGGGTFIN